VRLVGGSWSEAQLGDLRRLNPDVVVERAAAGETGTAADGAQLLALDTGAAGLLPPELGEPTAEMRGAAAATQALLTLLELIPRPSPSAGRAGELLFQSRR